MIISQNAPIFDKTVIMGILDNTKAVAEITFDDDMSCRSSEIHSYTTYDKISGHVTLAADDVITFDHVQIALVGSTKTYKVDQMGPSAMQTYASHVFLRLTMPISLSDYHGDFTLKPGEPRKFPFQFVVPEQLLPTACEHTTQHSHVKDCHLHLLPSMGEFLLPLDDLSPDMSKVSYQIATKLITHPVGAPSKAIAQMSRRVHIIPAMPENPPIHINMSSPTYMMVRTKKLRKSVFGGKLGTVTVTTTQPRPMVLNPSAPNTHPATIANINLKFTPHPNHSDAKPPRVGSVSTKIKATTYSSIRAVQEIPDDSTRCSPYERFSGSYHNTVSLGSRAAENVTWRYRVPTPAYARRDSGYSTTSRTTSHSSDEKSQIYSTTTPITTTTTSTDSSSDNECPLPYYEANIPVPLALPATKTWLPTFHSCLVSRFYSLIMNIDIHTPGTAVPPTSITLRAPVQIASLAREGRREEFRRMSEVMAEGGQVGEELPRFGDVVGRRRRSVVAEQERQEEEMRDWREREERERRRLQEIAEEVDMQLRRPSEVSQITTGSEDSGLGMTTGTEAPPGYQRRVVVR